MYHLRSPVFILQYFSVWPIRNILSYGLSDGLGINLSQYRGPASSYTHCYFFTTMAQWKKKKADEDKKDGPGVPMYSRYAKRQLRSWPNNAGECILIMQEDRNEKESLLPKTIAARSTHKNTEWCKRPYIAVSQAAACVNSAAPYLAAHFGKDSGAPVGKNGLREFAMFFETPLGKTFVDACKELDTSENGIPSDKNAVGESLGKFISFFTKNEGDLRRDIELHKSLSKVAVLSSRLYMASMTLLEANGLLNNRVSWAEKISGMRGEWLGNPEKRTLLVDFLKKDILTNAGMRKRERKGANFSDSDAKSETKSRRSLSGPSRKKQALIVASII